MIAECRTGTGRRETRKRDRRDVILTIAGEAFLEKGYSGTTMSSIAAALGGSKSTLWSYFASKPTLFEAALERAISVHHAQMAGSLDLAGDLASSLSRFAAQLITAATSAKAVALHRLVQSEAGRFPEVGEIFFRQVTCRTRDLLSNFLHEVMKQCWLRDSDALEAARVFTSLCMSGTHQRLMFHRISAPSGQDITADAALAVDIFLRAYVRAPDDGGT